MTNLRVAVVGCGYWGPNLVRNFSEHEQVELLYICDLDPAKMAKMGRRYPSVRLTTCYGDLLADPALDAIAIATPMHTHYALARQALQAGKHVLVEKPLCFTSAECLELIALAEEQGLVLMVDHTFIYHNAVQAIKQEIDRQGIGEILYFDSVRVNLGLFQSDANVIWDLAAHDLSIMDYLLGMTPRSIHATGACHTGNGIEDIAYLTLTFENDMIAHFHVSWLSPVKIRKIMIGGSKKMIVYDDLEPMEKVRLFDKGIQLTQPESDEKLYEKLVQYRLGDMYAPALAYKEALQSEVAHFVDCIARQQKPLTDGEFGLRIVQLMEAASVSLKTGQPYVFPPVEVS